MKNLFLLILTCVLYQAFQAQTIFQVKTLEKIPASGILVLLHEEYVGVTDQQGKITVNEILKGDTILFRDDDNWTTYVALENNPKTVEIIELNGKYTALPPISDEVMPIDEIAPIMPPEFSGPPSILPPDEPQTAEITEIVYEDVDEPAEFPGGKAALIEFINANLKYPEEARYQCIEGKCYLRFIVQKDGKIGKIKVMRGLAESRECDKEAIRIIKSMPKWMPAKIQGKAVSSYFDIPINFKLPK